MESIAKKYGLKLDDDWNKKKMHHLGRHPDLYHEWVLSQMKSIDKIPNLTQQQFISLFRIKVIQPVSSNPLMLRKAYWNNKK